MCIRDRLGLVQKHLAVIPGSVPNLIALPSGCKFAPRCPYVKEVCIQREPRLIETKPSHLVRCFMRDPETASQWAGVPKATWQFQGTEALAAPGPWVDDRPVSYTHLDVYKRQDYNIALAFIYVTTILTVVATLLGDILYSIVDPRIRYS